MTRETIAACALSAAAVACFLLPLANPDVFWHLSAARRILELGRLPEVDWLSSTMEGRPWTDFEWGTQLLWWAAFRAAGFWGLWAVKASLLAASAAAFWGTLRLYKPSPAAAALGLLAWSLALLPANDLRPENFSLLLFTLEWWALEALRQGRLPAALAGKGWRKAALSAAAVALFFGLWANLHAGFAYGLLLLAVAVSAAEPGRRGPLAALLACAALGTLATPHGPGLYPVLWEHAAGLEELRLHLREWQGPDLENPWLFPFWTVLLSSFLVLLGRSLQRGVPALHAAALCLFGLSAGRHVRTAPYFVAVAVPLLACHLPALGGSARLRRRVLAAAGLALGGFWAAKVAPQLSFADPLSARTLPDGIADFLESESAALGGRPLLNPWEWGGFLGFRLAPGYKVFVDGRYLFHPFLGPMREARQDPASYRAFLDRYGLELVLLRHDGKTVEMSAELPDGTKPVIARPAYLFFLPRADWAMVYWDGQGMVFGRRSALPAAWLNANEYGLFRPGDSEAAELLARLRPAARAQLDAEIARHAALAAEPGS